MLNGLYIQDEPIPVHRQRRAACGLISVSHARLLKGPALISPNFKSSFDKFMQAAVDCNVKIYLTSSFRKADRAITGNIVTPADHSCHMVGHALDINMYLSDGSFCNSACMKASPINTDVKCFTTKVKKSGLRWGNDFSTKDPVHFDDNLYLTNPTSWNTEFNDYQKNCKI